MIVKNKKTINKIIIGVFTVLLILINILFLYARFNSSKIIIYSDRFWMPDGQILAEDIQSLTLNRFLFSNYLKLKSKKKDIIVFNKIHDIEKIK